MKFGLFYEISVPRPWGRETEKTVYDNCLEQVALADSLGFDSVWAVEHHFLEEYSHCPAPELFLTACAMKTKKMRVGHGIVVCVPEFNHPIKIAERTAVLDILSGGRLDVGTGRSATWTELAGFRASPDETKKTWDEFVHCLPKMWTQERFSYQGRSWSMPQRTIVPKPYQKPHPPLWVAVTSPGTEIDAAERGMGSLGLTFGGFAEQDEKVKRYRKIIQNCTPVGDVVNEAVSTVNFLYCHEDDAEGVKVGKRLTGTFNYLAAQLLAAREAYPSKSYP
jgi:alkanesulfonate monooxygenase SsuD/methylene tetrahydromethanopterin reductase-like flavin-dependent oxidoreductase (luciferase family)